MKVLFIVLCNIIFISCFDKNIDIFETINIRLVDDKFKDTLRVQIREYYRQPKRSFSEKYVIPLRPYFLENEMRLYEYEDHFFYEDWALFRKINEDHYFNINSTFGHFKDFLWIPNFIFFDDASSDYNKIITYNDRFFKEEIFKDFKYAGILNSYKVSMLSVKYDTTFQDTIRTINFTNLKETYQLTEYKSYDSNFNLVHFGYKTDMDDLRIFTIMMVDYLKLKNFRETHGPIFQKRQPCSALKR